MSSQQTSSGQHATQRPSARDTTSTQQRVVELEACVKRQNELLARAAKLATAAQIASSYESLLYVWRLQEKLLPAGTRRRAAVHWLGNRFVRIAHALFRHRRRQLTVDSAADYQRWIARNEPSPAELQLQRSTRFLQEPRITVIATLDSGNGAHADRST